MIHNHQYIIKRSAIGSMGSLASIIAERVNGTALRWYISKVEGDELFVQATTYDGELRSLGEPIDNQVYPGKSAVISIIPTGVGCSIGGFAGDAAPATSLLASTVDYLITNPNAVNASDFINLPSNVVYAEGSSLDLFAEGLTNLRMPYGNRIGLIIEKSERQDLDVIFNVLNTTRAVHGVDIKDYVVTDQPIGSRCLENEAGAFVGTVDNPDVLLDACDYLISRGVTAIAVTTAVQDLPPESYADHFAGKYPNPVGGVEAVISHLITRRYGIPAAHAPLINMKQLDLADNIVDARGAGEMTSVSGLACVLIGLRRAPQLKSGIQSADVINVNNLLAVVAPAGCMGGIPVLAAQRHGIPVLAVQQNETILDVTARKLHLSNVVEVANYAEAAGLVLALRSGISVESIRRPLATMRPLQAVETLPTMRHDRQSTG